MSNNKPSYTTWEPCGRGCSAESVANMAEDGWKRCLHSILIRKHESVASEPGELLPVWSCGYCATSKESLGQPYCRKCNVPMGMSQTPDSRELEQLRKDVAEQTEELRKSLVMISRQASERDQLRAEVAAMRPVVEAAVPWAENWTSPAGYDNELKYAIDEYRKANNELILHNC